MNKCLVTSDRNWWQTKEWTPPVVRYSPIPCTCSTDHAHWVWSQVRTWPPKRIELGLRRTFFLSQRASGGRVCMLGVGAATVTRYLCKLFSSNKLHFILLVKRPESTTKVQLGEPVGFIAVTYRYIDEKLLRAENNGDSHITQSPPQHMKAWKIWDSGA